ncbi:Transcription initiation factor TFIID subunit A family protein [Acanthocheilonema viteae]
MSSNETATTSATVAITSTATVVSALPITVQAASHNSPAFVNMSVGELLQKQRRFAVVTVPTSRSVTSSPVGMGNRFPIKPISRQSLTDNMSHSPNCSLGINASSIPMKRTINDAFEDPTKLKEAAVETSQPNVTQKPSVAETVNAAGTTEQPHLVATPESTSILGSLQLDDLIRQIDPTSILDDPVKAVLTEFVDDFVDQVIERSCKLARHRGSDTLEAGDIDFILRRYYNYPSLPKQESKIKSESTENVQRNTEMAAHNQRMALIKKILKKP